MFDTVHRGGSMLTERQHQIWNYLVTYVDRHGYPPTVREIGVSVVSGGIFGMKSRE